MTDYKKYINALRKCAEEHENDGALTGYIVVSDLCKDTADLLERLEQDFELNEAIKRFKHNAEYERTHGNLQGCVEFRRLVEWLKELRAYKEHEGET